MTKMSSAIELNVLRKFCALEVAVLNNWGSESATRQAKELMGSLARGVGKHYSALIPCHPEEGMMRAFIIACAVTIVLAVGGVLALQVSQKPTGMAFSSEGVRINPTWSYRKVIRRKPPSPGREVMSKQEIMSATGDIEVECEDPSGYLFVDFGIAVEDDPCSESQ
jgi:hypothetical protein